MAHRVYHCEGYVLGSKNVGEANKLFFIFTRELGLIPVIAQGVRKLKSKLSGSVQNFYPVRISVVRGREFWRLVAAERLIDLDEIFRESEKFQLTVRVFSLIKKFTPAETKEVALYDDLKKVLAYVGEKEVEIYKRSASNIELVLVLRVMSELGYVKAESVLAPFLQFRDWRDEAVAEMEKHKRLATEVINTAFTHSHL